ncbi:hypothetical protein ANN_12992 [Periplaneta americana]|uniref:DUF4817 domain-containing protein n=1 Tax=Periplaneta americana TaxID=6978 RepID=A0ABQ8TKP5_PERAM|nr:hypothetical protein ANN_12992 [Periplaneta americana]
MFLIFSYVETLQVCSNENYDSNAHARGKTTHRVKTAEFTVQQKVKCYWLAELKFPIAVQSRFSQENGANAPERHTIVKWYKQLLKTGSVLRKKGSGIKAVTAAKVEDVRQAFERSPRKSIRRTVQSWVFLSRLFTALYIKDCDLEHTKSNLCKSCSLYLRHTCTAAVHMKGDRIAS